LRELMQPAEDDGIRLRAAKAVLDSLRGFLSDSPRTETTTTRTMMVRTQRVVEAS
jgi:hypothetical protein